MKKLFIHLPLFRLLSPLFSGVLVYLLILLINNSVEQLDEQFFGEELYVCIGLSFIIQELSRLLLIVFKRLLKGVPFIYALLIQFVSSLVLCALVVTFAINSYYKYVSGYSVNSEELWIFNSIFCTVTFIYILLSLSHSYLYKENTKRLNDELLRKQMVEDDFIQFKNEINPNLLFDSLEAILVLMKQKKDDVDHLIDHIAGTYRYVLANNKRQLVLIEEELQAVNHLIELLQYLPYRSIKLTNHLNSSFLVVPGSVLKLIEGIARTSILQDHELDVNLNESESSIELSYVHSDKITTPFSVNLFEELQRIYTIYSTKNIHVTITEETRHIQIPKLNLKA